jgi:hypothetical protein
MTWMSLLSDVELAEVELARYYTKLLRHPTPEGARLILICKLADALDRATGSGDAPELTPEALHEHRTERNPPV